MTITKTIFALVVSGIMMLSGLTFGKFTGGVGNSLAPNAEPATAPSPGNDFYLSDYKTGYTDGYAAGTSDQPNSVATTDRAGYNDGFKEGFADGYQARQTTAPTQYQRVSRSTNYRSSPARRGNSKLKTALTIAAPAAIGAGIGVMAGGKKGAAAGALIGGGGGALYHLYKNRQR